MNSDAKTKSEATTNGVRVRVQSRYLKNQSSPIARHYVFAYTVEIANMGDAQVKLVTRHWVITNAEGQIEEVRGPGVVGHTPVLRPKEAFEYSSGAVLVTPRGTMHGSYQMVGVDDSEFDATIAPFLLEQPFSLN